MVYSEITQNIMIQILQFSVFFVSSSHDAAHSPPSSLHLRGCVTPQTTFSLRCYLSFSSSSLCLPLAYLFPTASSSRPQGRRQHWSTNFDNFMCFSTGRGKKSVYMTALCKKTRIRINTPIFQTREFLNQQNCPF